MKRDTVITALLVIAGIILAFVLFGAWAFWKGMNSRRSSSQWFPHVLGECVWITDHRQSGSHLTLSGG